MDRLRITKKNYFRVELKERNLQNSQKDRETLE
jgi:hypothetical protein